MIIRHSHQLLENLAEIERKIQIVEKLLEDLGVNVDQEKVLLLILNRKKDGPLSRRNTQD